jgi:hypothetical protein
VERSTLAWFRAADPDTADPLDDTATLVAQLRQNHHVDVFTAATAHDFVWRHFRAPYDLCVYELRDGGAHEFVHPYLVHYPGVIALRHQPRRAHRFLQCARLIVTPHSALVDPLHDQYPDVPIRYAPPAVPAVPAMEDDDVVVAMEWPPTGDVVMRALTGIAAGKAVVVFETVESADWPALNPQTWQPRSAGPFPAAAPIVVSIDPCDEEHSLKLALARLRTDSRLREQLGAAARAWWARNATPQHAVEAWQRVIGEARALPPCAPGAMPLADGTEKAREILAEFGLSVDLFNHEEHEGHEA